LEGSLHEVNMRWQTFKQTKSNCAALLSVLIGVIAVATPKGSGFLDLQSSGAMRKHALYASEREGESHYIARYVPTPHEVVDRMLELARVRKGDLVYDLGSGDGRIVITAAQRYGVKAVGFEIDPGLVKNSRDSIRAAGLEHLVEIREQDIRTVDLSPASVLTMYLHPAANLRLRSAIMRQLKPGARVVSHDFGMGNWKPDRIDQLTDSAGHSRTIYLWRIVQTP
jgi:SAM-dependent methyltransferase